MLASISHSLQLLMSVSKLSFHIFCTNAMLYSKLITPMLPKLSFLFLFYPILSCPVLSCPVLSYPILSFSNPNKLNLPYLTLHYLTKPNQIFIYLSNLFAGRIMIILLLSLLTVQAFQPDRELDKNSNRVDTSKFQLFFKVSNF